MNSFNRTYGKESQGPKVYPIFNNRKRPRDSFAPDETGGKVTVTSLTNKPPMANFTQPSMLTVNFGQRPGFKVRQPAPQTFGSAFRSSLPGSSLPAVPSTSKGQFSAPKQWVPFKDTQMQGKRLTLSVKQEKDAFFSQASTPKASSKKFSAPMIPKSTKPPVLSLISATIHGVREWSQYRDHISLIFEIIGIVDSAVSRSPDQLAKHFILCDSSSTINCCFYEIDRELPNVIRRQWYRCIGKLDKRSEVFHCISIRPATQQEQQLFPKFVEMSTAEMRMKIMRVNEP